MPKTRKLWRRVAPSGKRVPKKRADKAYELEDRNCEFINAALSDETDVTQSRKLNTNVNPKVVFEGVQTGHDGFVIGADEAENLLAKNPQYANYLKPFINGTDLLSGRYEHKREYVVDMSELDMVQASALPDLLAIPRERVLPDWKRNAAAERKETEKERGEHQNRLDAWWALKRPRADLQRAIARLPRYVACSAVMKRPIFVFLSSAFLPTNALKVFAFADDYSFGILQSG